MKPSGAPAPRPQVEPAPPGAVQRSSDWTALRAAPPLAAGEVHVWRFRVPAPDGMPAGWQAMLAPDERDRVARKRIPLDARRTLASRACLRILLGGYTGVPPRDIAFGTTAAGKPHLAAAPESSALEFNLSHSGDWIMLAFARTVPIGVDVECERELDHAELVNHFFSPAEREAWSRLPPDDHARAFFAAWTRKEAFVKALGIGLTESLVRFTVGFGRETPMRMVGFEPQVASAPSWLIVPVDVAPGYAGAVAIGRESVVLRTFTFDVG